MNWTSGTAETVVIVLLAVCLVGVVVVLRTVQKMATRLLLVVLLVGAGVALWLQREELQACRTQCACRLFGQTVEFPELAGNPCP